MMRQLAAKRTWGLLGAAALVFSTGGYLLADGLHVNYGRGLTSIFYDGLEANLQKAKGMELKVIQQGIIKAGQEIPLNSVIYEGRAKCLAIVLARGEGADVDLFVYDAANGNEIGNDQLEDNYPVVEWQSADAPQVVVNLKMRNAGDKDAAYTLLGNW